MIIEKNLSISRNFPPKPLDNLVKSVDTKDDSLNSSGRNTEMTKSVYTMGISVNIKRLYASSETLTASESIILRGMSCHFSDTSSIPLGQSLSLAHDNRQHDDTGSLPKQVHTQPSGPVCGQASLQSIDVFLPTDQVHHGQLQSVAQL